MYRSTTLRSISRTFHLWSPFNCTARKMSSGAITLDAVVAKHAGKMDYVRLGGSGLVVSKLCLGCMSFGSSKWQFFTGDTTSWVLNEDEALPIIKAAYDVGINFWDTSNNYSHGESERVLGAALKKYKFPRDEMVIATKVFGTVARDVEEKTAGKSRSDLQRAHYANNGGLSRKSIFDAVDASLARLGVEYIDLLQIHRADMGNVDVKETMRALHDVVQAGKVRYIGASSMYAWQFTLMQMEARMNGWTEFITMQNYYNPGYREEEREMMPTLKHFGVASIPWGPMGGGLFTRPFDTKELTERGEFMKGMATEADIEINKVIASIAARLDVPMARVALAWTLRNPQVFSPIVGISKAERLDDACEALKLELSNEDYKAIGKPYVIRQTFGH